MKNHVNFDVFFFSILWRHEKNGLFYFKCIYFFETTRTLRFLAFLNSVLYLFLKPFAQQKVCCFTFGKKHVSVKVECIF